MSKPQTDMGVGERPVFWLSIGIPVLLFFITGYFAWRGKNLDFSSEGFKEFMSISALPLICLGASVPLSTLVWRIHATRQTAEQIIVTRLKNNVDAFYAHRKAFIDYFSYIEEVTYEGGVKGMFKVHPRLHLKFFANQSPDKGMPSVDSGQFASALETLGTIRNKLEEIIASNDAKRRIRAYAAASHLLKELGILLVLKELYERLPAEGRDYELPDGRVFRSMGTELEHLIGAYRYSRSMMRLLCEFAGYPVDYFTASQRKGLQDVDKGTAYEKAPPFDQWARDYRYVELSANSVTQ